MSENVFLHPVTQSENYIQHLITVKVFILNEQTPLSGSNISLICIANIVLNVCQCNISTRKDKTLLLIISICAAPSTTFLIYIH